MLLYHIPIMFPLDEAVILHSTYFSSSFLCGENGEEISVLLERKLLWLQDKLAR